MFENYPKIKCYLEYVHDVLLMSVQHRHGFVMLANETFHIKSWSRKNFTHYSLTAQCEKTISTSKILGQVETFLNSQSHPSRPLFTTASLKNYILNKSILYGAFTKRWRGLTLFCQMSAWHVPQNLSSSKNSIKIIILTLRMKLKTYKAEIVEIDEIFRIMFDASLHSSFTGITKQCLFFNWAFVQLESSLTSDFF